MDSGDDSTYTPTQKPSQDSYPQREKRKRKAARTGKNPAGQLHLFLPGGALDSQTSDTQYFSVETLPPDDDISPVKEDDEDDEMDSSAHENQSADEKAAEEQTADEKPADEKTADEKIASLKAENYDLQCMITRMQQDLVELESDNTDKYDLLEASRCDRKADNWYIGQLEAEIERLGGIIPDRLQSQISVWPEDDVDDNKEEGNPPEEAEQGLTEFEGGAGVVGAHEDATSSTIQEDDTLARTVEGTQEELGSRNNYERDMLRTIVAGAPSYLRVPKRQKTQK